MLAMPLLRRVTFDLTGLPPTPADVAAFLSGDSPQAYEKVVSRLLDSPHYGERWARHWLDVVRYGESTVNGDLRNNRTTNAKKVNQPIAAFLMDLKSRGMLQETLVIFGTEFGRTPAAQGTDGRDHHPHAFGIWLAGGGVRGGMAYGQTDEYGYYVAANKVTMPDFRATVLHLLGLDHELLTFRHGGRDYRLTDVHGKVVQPVLA